MILQPLKKWIQSTDFILELKYAVPVIQIASVVGVQYREYIKRNINTLNMHFRNWHVMWTR